MAVLGTKIVEAFSKQLYHLITELCFAAVTDNTITPTACVCIKQNSDQEQLLLFPPSAYHSTKKIFKSRSSPEAHDWCLAGMVIII